MQMVQPSRRDAYTTMILNHQSKIGMRLIIKTIILLVQCLKGTPVPVQTGLNMNNPERG